MAVGEVCSDGWGFASGLDAEGCLPVYVPGASSAVAWGAAADDVGSVVGVSSSV